MSPRVVWALGMWSVVFSLPVNAGELLSTQTQHQDGRFTARSELLIHLPEPRVRAILTHYENLPRVNDGITAVEILSRGEQGNVIMKVDATGCILFVCLDYTWVQEAMTLASGEIVTIIDPENSDFREGRITYQLLPSGDSTRLIMDADVVPSFWFPPVIGPWLIQNTLRQEALETAKGVERVAADQKQSSRR